MIMSYENTGVLVSDKRRVQHPYRFESYHMTTTKGVNYDEVKEKSVEQQTSTNPN